MAISKKAAAIAKRYEAGFITDEQLERYHELGVLTDGEYDAIYETKHPKQEHEQEQEAESEAE